jgi:hypothetical protein
MRLTRPLTTRACRAALLAGLAACGALPIPVLAQRAAVPTLLEPYVSRTRLDPGVLGQRARLSGVGARLLYQVLSDRLDDRLLVGAFVTHAPSDGRGVTTSQVGAVADVRLGGRPIAGRVEPLLSLGAGAFRTRWDAPVVSGRALCLRPRDAASLGGACLAAPGRRRDPATSAALSPAIAARVSLLPGVALRVDARDLVVYRGRPRHGFELTTGVSLMR